MYFRDLLSGLTETYDISDMDANAILIMATSAYLRGNAGLPFHDKVRGTGGKAIVEVAEILSEMNPKLEKLSNDDKLDVAELLVGAWHEAITRKERVTVHLDNENQESFCGDCGRILDSDAEVCSSKDCGSTDIARQVMIEVNAPFAEEWADSDQTIDGSSWETPSDSPNFAYTLVTDHPGLVRELKAEGYKLDLSNYIQDENEEVEDDA